MTHRPYHHRLSRREFLRSGAMLSVGVGASGLLAACQPAIVMKPAGETDAPAADQGSQPAKSRDTQPSIQNQPVPEPETTRVAFVKTDNRAQGVHRALALLGPVDVTQRSILLKPNFNSDDPAPGSTHPDVLQTLIDELWQRQAQSITLADRSGMGNTRRVMEKLGIFELAKTSDIKPIVLDELEQDEWEMIELEDSHWRQGFPFARCCLDADAVVQTCCLKTHRYGGHFTMSLKNSVGLVAKFRPGDSHNYMNELHSSRHQRQMIAEINAAYSPVLVVMDGVEAFVRGGPASGERINANVVLAGTDRVAIDAVGVAILRHFGTTSEVSQGTIFEQAQIARAAELGLGVDGSDKIELVTDDAASEAYADTIRQILVLG